jgi:hypothetical protein
LPEGFKNAIPKGISGNMEAGICNYTRSMYGVVYWLNLQEIIVIDSFEVLFILVCLLKLALPLM